VDLLSSIDLAAAAAYLTLALLLAVHSVRSAPAVSLVVACAATGCWAFAAAADRLFPARLPALLPALDAARLLAWVIFLGIAYRIGRRASPASSRKRRLAIYAGGALGLGLLVGEIARAPAAGAGFVARLYAQLAIAVAGLSMTEALAREARTEGLWRIRYLCLGGGAMLLYDLFFWSDVLLFRRVDPVLEASRGAVSLIAAPLVGVAAARNSAWSTDLAVARRAVLHGAVLIAVGIYLVTLAGAGALLRSHGGEWGRLLSPAVALGGLLLLALLASSRPVAGSLRRALGRYLFTHRHDYREQWHRFAAALTWQAEGRSLAARALGALADVTGSTRGGLWWREPDGFSRLADLGLGAAAPATFAAGPFAAELDRGGGSIVELGSDRGAAQGGRQEWLPEWLLQGRDAWLLVPLAVGGRAVGFAALGRSRGARALDPEDEELLRSAAHHAASYLAAEQTARRLEEARRFEEISRRFAFVAHDLRNLTHELTLALANARKHIARPEFQRDLLLSMEDSVAGMQRLLDKLAERKPVPPAIPVTDLRALVVRSLGGRAEGAPAVRLDLDGEEPLVVACDPDRLASLSGHLVRNAVEAAGPEGHVTVRVRRVGGASVFEVEDDGPGMTAEFLRERLHHPFRSSKPSGFGLGLYECQELALEVGGDLAIDSEPGRGTLARLRLPLADGHRTAPSEAFDAGA
jgi:putative PEP-CTERM system histidine kinase